MKCPKCGTEVDQTERGHLLSHGTGPMSGKTYVLRNLLESDGDGGLTCTCEKCQTPEQKQRRQTVRVTP